MKINFQIALLSAILMAPLAISNANAAPPSAGLSLPKNAVSWDEIAPRFQGLLSKLAKEEEIGLNASGASGEVEVFAWRGASYKAGRASFVQMSLNGALAKAGYVVRMIDSNQLRHVSLSEHFGAQEDAPFQPDIWKLPGYFVARDEKQGRALVGALIESKDALALGLLEVPLRAATRETLPSVLPGAILIKDGNNAMKGVAPPQAPTFGALARVPRTARGQIKDAGGKPLAGALITVQSSVVGGLATLHRGQTDRNGIYNIRVSSGIARVASASASIAFAGKNYGLPLSPADGRCDEFDSAQGHVENFRLQTFGVTSPQSANNPVDAKGYYGGSLRLSWRSEIEPGGTFEVTLTPDGAQLGGGRGRTFVYRFANRGFEAPLNNIPLGRYKLSARLFLEGEAAPLRVALFPSDDLAAAVPILFEPVSATNPDFGYSGVRPLIVSIRP